MTVWSSSLYKSEFQEKGNMSLLTCVALSFVCRGSKFLKAWMQHLEDHADLRYANVTEVYGD